MRRSSETGETSGFSVGLTVGMGWGVTGFAFGRVGAVRARRGGGPVARARVRFVAGFFVVGFFTIRFLAGAFFTGVVWMPPARVSFRSNIASILPAFLAAAFACLASFFARRTASLASLRRRLACRSCSLASVALCFACAAL